MGCGSSSSTGNNPYHNNYPKQQTTPARRNNLNLYDDNDPTDDIPPEAVVVGGTKPKPAASKPKTPPPEPKPKAPTPQPDPIPKTPPPEPKPKQKESEDKIIVSAVVKPPSDDDLEDVGPGGEPKGDITEGVVSKVTMGRQSTALDTRPGPQKTTTSKPSVPSGKLWVDENFTMETAFEGKEKVEWKRPGEIASNPCLFSEGTTRFDIGQGAAGTCWFLSIVASLADKEDILKQVIPPDAYKIGTPEYDGIFHCKFWKFGEWFDVYIDDFLPIRPGTDQPWGARSSTDPNEMWVSLLEKAFAKFQGSYMKAEGGWAGDAFIYLTGGIAEKLEIKNYDTKKLYLRLRNALVSGSIIACSVPKEKDGQGGLVGGHAYTLTGATLVKPSNTGKQIALFRVRNPWGGEKGEWNGDYSDKSIKWSFISDDVKNKLNVKSKGDGEFWMTLTDYYDYFSDTHVCNFTPDFDEDGKQDNLNKVSCIFGEWDGPTAAGKDMEHKMKNQRFIFTVPKKGLESDNKLPVVLQFIQHRESRKGKNHYFIRADLYKIEEQFKKTPVCLALDELTNNTTFWGGHSLSYRYRLEPGDYLIVPTTMEPGQEKEFLIRLFSSVALPCKELKESPSVFIRRFETVNEVNGETITTDKLQHFCGSWKANKNAGGQVKHRSFCNNPQYVFENKGPSAIPLMVSLKQELSGNKVAIGFKIYKTENTIKAPVDLKYLWNNYKNGTVPTVQGDQVFIMAFEGAGLFMLEKGSYMLLPFLEDPDCERRYVLTIGNHTKDTVSLKGMNTAD